MGLEQNGRLALIFLPILVGLGLLQSLSFAPWHSDILQIGSLSLALWVLRRVFTRKLARSAAFALFHLATLIGGLSWLHISMTRYGGMPQMLSGLALIAFCSYLASFGALAWVLSLLAERHGLIRGPVDRGLLLGALWAFAEILRGWVFTGFPWLSLGYAHTDGILRQWAPWAGVYAVSAWAMCIASWLADLPGCLRSARGPRAALAPVVAIVAVLLVSQLIDVRWARPLGSPIRSLLLQPNIDQGQKFLPERLERQHDQIIAMLGRSQSQLAVTPETAWIMPWALTPPATRQRLLEALERHGGVLALGMPLGREVETGAVLPILSNSAILLQASGALLSRYDKQHLVPFGEFVPWGFRWFVDLMHIPLGDFARGPQPAPVFTVAGHGVAFNICYEDLFPEEIAGQVRQGAGLIVNMSNLGWFGNSHALAQHLQIGRMRSLELQRPTLRATNTGATAAIDAQGSVSAYLPHLTEEVLQAEVHPTQGLTPYARWDHRASLALLGAMILLALIWARTTLGVPSSQSA
jgi:apolipoprotein N-acyltransferase